MNIRKIIKEEIEGFDWVEDIDYLQGDCYILKLGILNKTHKLVVDRVEGNNVIFTTPLGVSQPMSLEDIRRYTEAGVLIPCENINENFDWTKDIDAYTPIEDLRRGDEVNVVWRNDALMEDSLDSCDEYTHHFQIGDEYEVDGIDNSLQGDGIYCNCYDLSERYNLGDCRKSIYSVRLMDSNGWGFWVTEDMLRVIRI